MTGPLFYTPEEIAALLGVSRITVYRRMRRRRLPAAKVDGKWLTPRDEFDAWVRARAEESRL